MKLITFMAKACHYAQQHIDDPIAWPTKPIDREDYLQCVSYQMACFLAQNTHRGRREGVEWDIVLKELTKHPLKSTIQWERILNNKAKMFDGWKKCK